MFSLGEANDLYKSPYFIKESSNQHMKKIYIQYMLSYHILIRLLYICLVLLVYKALSSLLSPLLFPHPSLKGRLSQEAA